jgi:decaprenyl-phosphate phosphoribosyltransferase
MTTDIGPDAVTEAPIRAAVRSARPRQWLKNVLVFAAPGAAGVLDQPPELLATVLTFAAFCLASSGTYYWNDILDVEADRIHPTKRHRPIASGALALGPAKVIGTVMVLAAPVLAALTGRWQVMAIVISYLALTILYSTVLKRIAVVDLVTVAAGFVLRAAAGAAAVDVPMSSWFVVCITFGALFVVTGKRYAELIQRGAEAASSRSTLAIYPLDYLRTVLGIACAGAILTYSLWAFESKGARGAEQPLYELSMVPLVIALLRYLLVLYRGEGAAPEEVFLRDRTLQVSGLIWVVIYGLAVYTS